MRVRDLVPRAIGFFLVSILGLLFTSRPAAAQLTPNLTGRWTAATSWGEPAVHLALLPAYGEPYHSEILWWLGREHHAVLYGGLWSWYPGDYDCLSFPTAKFGELPFLAPPENDLIFCSSNSHQDDGSLLLAGGTQGGTTNGKRHTWIFDPIGKTWAYADSMSQRRWYATGTELADGKTLVVSGSAYRHLLLWGGKVNAETAPSDSALLRFADVGRGVWDPEVRISSTPDWPDPREEQTLTSTNWGTTYVFGGQIPGGVLRNDLWTLVRQPNRNGTDYDYTWAIQGHHQLSLAPDPRAEHAAVAASEGETLFVSGGRLGLAAVSAEVWRLNRFQGQFFWTQLAMSGSPQPGPRYGHTALYDAPRRRILVFGGRSVVNGGPTDNEVWSLQLSPTSLNQATWIKLTVSGEKPAARLDHALGYDPLHWPEDAFVFGGDLGSGQLANDLWNLHIDPVSGDVTWIKLDENVLGGAWPSPRANHAIAIDGEERRAFIFGGRTSGGVVDDNVYVAQLESMHAGELRTWSTFTRQGSKSLTGHSMYWDPQYYFARIPEIFDPAASQGQQWTAYAAAPQLQDWYPHGFLAPSGDVFYSGPDDVSSYFRLASHSWETYPATGASGFKGGSSVMYRPGKVMKCGTRNTESFGSPSVGTTRWIDLNNPLGAWISSSNEMLGRTNHNLVLLPNGRVLAVGGTDVQNNDALSAVVRPEWWEPDAAGGMGRWFGRDTLASDFLARNYHSTALLLPDGRVLSAGGADTNPDRMKANIYCPPYLFNADGSPAPRPAINAAPDRVEYGQQFSLCMPYLTDPSRVVLIRPGAVTHGFDQDQRYVALGFSTVEYGSRAIVTAPSSANLAPPGDYLLFILNAAGVPAVARWIRLGGIDNVVDGGNPAGIFDLTLEAVTSSTLTLSWTIPGDDGMSGQATSYDLRRSTSWITAQNFYQATPVTGLPIPACPGGQQTFTVTGLPSCTHYYFAIRALDEGGHVSPMGNVIQAQTSGEACGGGEGAFAQDTRGRTEEDRATPAATSPNVTSTGASGARSTALVAEYEHTAGGLRWTLRSVARSSLEGITASDTGDVILQYRDPEIGWRSRAQLTGLPYPAEILSLIRPGRVVFLDGASLDRVSDRFDGLELTADTRVRIAASADSATYTRTVAAGDSATLEYQASTRSAPAGVHGYLRFQGGVSSAAAATNAREALPAQPVPRLEFALYPSQPNPVQSGARIRFALPEATQISLDLFDPQGRKVRSLASGRFEAGEHVVAWDRSAGSTVRAGVYYCRLMAGSRRAQRTLIVLAE